MRADRIVILLPLPDDLPGMIKTQKPVNVQAFVSEPAVKAFDVGVVDRLTRAIEYQFDSMTMRPCIKCFADEFRAVIDRNHFRHTFEPDNPFQNTAYPIAID